MSHFANNHNLDLQLFGILLRPSALSGFVSLFSAITTVAYTAVSNVYNGSFTLAQGNYNSIGNKLDSNQFVSNLPLLTFWLLVGVVVYMFATNIVGAIHSAAELEAELSHFTNMNRKNLVFIAVQKLSIRIIGLGLWIFYMLYFLHTTIPYVLALSVKGTTLTSPLRGVEYFVLAVLILSLSLHVHAILLRIIALRPRIFSSALYVD